MKFHIRVNKSYNPKPCERRNEIWPKNAEYAKIRRWETLTSSNNCLPEDFSK